MPANAELKVWIKYSVKYLTCFCIHRDANGPVYCATLYSCVTRWATVHCSRVPQHDNVQHDLVSLTDVNNALARPCQFPDVKLLFLHVLQTTLMKHDSDNALKWHVILSSLSQPQTHVLEVGWSLTSLFSKNTAISDTKGQGWRVILLPSEGRLAIY